MIEKDIKRIKAKGYRMMNSKVFPRAKMLG